MGAWPALCASAIKLLQHRYPDPRVTAPAPCWDSAAHPPDAPRFLVRRLYACVRAGEQGRRSVPLPPATGNAPAAAAAQQHRALPRTDNPLHSHVWLPPDCNPIDMAEQADEKPPTQPLQRAPTTRRKRALLICAEDTPQAAAACEWALSNVYQEGDVVHLT